MVNPDFQIGASGNATLRGMQETRVDPQQGVPSACAPIEVNMWDKDDVFKIWALVPEFLSIS